MTAQEALTGYIDTLTIVDTHEHLPNEADWAAREGDVLEEWLAHYFSADLVSAGLPLKTLEETIRNSTKSLGERWETVEPYWRAAANTGYARALDIAARDLYGLPGVSRETIEALDTEFKKRRRQAAQGASYYHHVLKDKSQIEVSLNDWFEDTWLVLDRDFFRTVFRLEGVTDLADRESFEKLGDRVGIRIHSLDDYQQSVESAIDKAYERGAVAVKIPFAYRRTLRFEKRTRHEAESLFNGLFELPGGKDSGVTSGAALQPLEDYMLHAVLRIADQRGLVVQVHTGLQEGSGNIISNSNPELLVNLFLEYRNVKFDIFHMAWPYQMTLAAIAKNFPNVFIDMCWAHIISPESSVRALVEYLDSVPASKISAFGGDYLFPDGVYGHQRIARENVARALSMKVEQGVFDLDRAMELAGWLFRENPKRIFGLDL